MGVLRPAGPLPSRVYWTRRFVVLGLPLLVVIVIVWALVGRGGSPQDANDVNAEGSGEAGEQAPDDGSDEEPADPGAPQACAPEALGLTLAADSASYAAAAVPTFTVTLENVGEVDCLVDAGSGQLELAIVSGEDRIWSSRDCPAGAVERKLLLQPGKSDVTQAQWTRVRSAEGCATGLPAVKSGTYSATLTVAGAASAPQVFVLE
ncbi:hypothetical protein QUV83_08450 [Cellulomonas cellasea]|uniref:hypothetical protein n=1 Tax=Cellulomonas cellasea TaxID=43670 RepID=UPI0025A3C88A|nr:hypothetical protein [Cellulomonas cellasea]MDM8084790.1 hypothetical protein [Cellulomonas cellasea]